MPNRCKGGDSKESDAAADGVATGKAVEAEAETVTAVVVAAAVDKRSYWKRQNKAATATEAAMEEEEAAEAAEAVEVAEAAEAAEVAEAAEAHCSLKSRTRLRTSALPQYPANHKC